MFYSTLKLDQSSKITLWTVDVTVQLFTVHNLQCTYVSTFRQNLLSSSEQRWDEFLCTLNLYPWVIQHIKSVQNLVSELSWR